MRKLLHSLKTMLFDEGGVGEIFSHLRNLLMATVIIAAGSYVIRRAADVELFGVLNLELSGIAIAIVGFVLFFLNLIDGLLKINRLGGRLALKISFVALYVFFSLRIVQFVVLLRSG
jgi:hypothetical protein